MGTSTGASVDVFLSLSKYLSKVCALIPGKLWLVLWPSHTLLCNTIYIYWSGINKEYPWVFGCICSL